MFFCFRVGGLIPLPRHRYSVTPLKERGMFCGVQLVSRLRISKFRQNDMTKVYDYGKLKAVVLSLFSLHM